MTFAMNPGMMAGKVDMGSFKAPQDISVLAATYGGSGSTSQAPSATGAGGTAAAASESSPAAKTGAGCECRPANRAYAPD